MNRYSIDKPDTMPAMARMLNHLEATLTAPDATGQAAPVQMMARSLMQGLMGGERQPSPTLLYQALAQQGPAVADAVKGLMDACSAIVDRAVTSPLILPVAPVLDPQKADFMLTAIDDLRQVAPDDFPPVLQVAYPPLPPAAWVQTGEGAHPFPALTRALDGVARFLAQDSDQAYQSLPWQVALNLHIKPQLTVVCDWLNEVKPLASMAINRNSANYDDASYRSILTTALSNHGREPLLALSTSVSDNPAGLLVNDMTLDRLDTLATIYQASRDAIDKIFPDHGHGHPFIKKIVGRSGDYQVVVPDRLRLPEMVVARASVAEWLRESQPVLEQEPLLPPAPLGFMAKPGEKRWVQRVWQREVDSTSKIDETAREPYHRARFSLAIAVEANQRFEKDPRDSWALRFCGVPAALEEKLRQPDYKSGLIAAFPDIEPVIAAASRFSLLGSTSPVPQNLSPNQPGYRAG